MVDWRHTTRADFLFPFHYRGLRQIEQIHVITSCKHILLRQNCLLIILLLYPTVLSYFLFLDITAWLVRVEKHVSRV